MNVLCDFVYPMKWWLPTHIIHTTTINSILRKCISLDLSLSLSPCPMYVIFLFTNIKSCPVDSTLVEYWVLGFRIVSTANRCFQRATYLLNKTYLCHTRMSLLSKEITFNFIAVMRTNYKWARAQFVNVQRPARLTVSLNYLPRNDHDALVTKLNSDIDSLWTTK